MHDNSHDWGGESKLKFLGLDSQALSPQIWKYKKFLLPPTPTQPSLNKLHSERIWNEGT